jgi:uncharacterized protein DUF3788
METMILKDPAVSPSATVLKNALKTTYSTYQELITAISAKGFDLAPQWQYYRDGKAWLCKVQYKKKTVFWLSVWDKYFKVVFYFTEKHFESIKQLDIDDKIKEKFVNGKAIGKMFPLAIKIEKTSQLRDVLRIIDYKKSVS